MELIKQDLEENRLNLLKFSNKSHKNRKDLSIEILHDETGINCN